MIKIQATIIILSLTFIQCAFAQEYFCNGLKATIVGTEGNDHLIGTPGDDVIVALGGSDIVEGGAGNDTICGNSGFNKLRGGPGNDTILGGSDQDAIFGDEGDDYIHGGEGSNMGCYQSECGLNGGPGDDEIHGGDGVDLINGDEGNDRLYGHGGANKIHGGDGDDYLENGDDGNANLSCVAGGCGLYGDNGNDEIHGGRGMDHLIGGEGNDKLYGTANLNILEGGPGDDILYMGENGTSTCRPARSCGLFGGEGNDQLFGSKEMDFMDGGPGNDILRGGDEWDILVGGPGDDELYGENGDDELYGGPGADLCVGGEGNDTCNGEAPFTEEIAEDDDVCHKDVEEKISCRGPGQPEFYELTFDQIISGQGSIAKTKGTVVYEYSQSLGVYNVIDGLINADMNPNKCIHIKGNYKPTNSKKTQILVKSLDEYGRNLKMNISGVVMANVIQSTMTNSCNGQVMQNMPPFMLAPMIIDVKTLQDIILNQYSLNVINHNESGRVNNGDVNLTFTLKAKGRLFQEAQP